MTQKPTSPGDAAPIRVTIVTLDNHLAGAVRRAERALAREMPGLTLSLHAASDWAADEQALARCRADIASADIVIATMLFIDEHIRAVLPALAARRNACDAMVAAMSAGEVIKLTRMGGLKMDGSDKGPLALLKRLRGSSKQNASSGAGQMAMLRRLPKLLRFIPGPAQDLRAYFLTLQAWLSASDENLAALVRLLVTRYADGPRRALRRLEAPAEPIIYPEVGVYHPAMAQRLSERLGDLPAPTAPRGTVGLLILRSYALARDSAHYDGVIAAMEARGLRVIPAFASGLDARPAIERFFMKDGRSTIDALVSLTGFSLVGGPAYNDSGAAEDILARLDRPYISAHPLEFQSLQHWGASREGLTPIEATIMVSLPELDGATTPMPFGGRSDGGECCGCARRCSFPSGEDGRAMRACQERAEALAARVAKLVALRNAPKAERKIAVVLFNFPPNAGAVGSAAYLSVFESAQNTLKALAADGYAVDVPESADALRRALLEGNSARFGADANVAARISADDHVRRETHLGAIERQWGPAPGRIQADSSSIHVLGLNLGNVFLGVQPSMGIEGDPMRLLFEQGFAPTHAFSAFYRYLREDFGAHAVLHFGTHGALEFMPGKQVGLSADCWPERLIGDLPNIYLYAANNPSEGAVAKRRSAATLISHLTPPIAQAGLYRGLMDLKGALERWRAADGEGPDAEFLADLIGDQAEALDLTRPSCAADFAQLEAEVAEIETSLIPEGMHVVGAPPSEAERIDLLLAAAQARGAETSREAVAAIVAGAKPDGPLLEDLARMDRLLRIDGELPGLLKALDGGYVRPAPGGDVIRTPETLPTGRNLHGFDPFRIPSAYAVRDGARQAQRLLDRHMMDHGALPETVALVLWGSDNLKSEGGPIAQALALMGAAPRLDSYGRLAGAQLLPLETLGRPRIDVMTTLSGIFRDLLPLQTRMLAEAALLAASADEPEALNFVRKHALAFQAKSGCDLETAALRVFSNAEGAYGANVNQLIDAGCWTDEGELADAYEARKSFAYGVKGPPRKDAAVFQDVLARVDLAYQNLESIELGVTTIDHYVDTLGGVSRAVKRAKGADAAVYISDQTQGEGKVRSLAEQVALESRARTLNPRWYEAMLRHGYEGVRQIEAQVTNTLGWSAATGQVAPWIYQRVTETFVLDQNLRDRLAELNPKACARVAERLIEASERQYWTPDEATLAALRAASDALEDRLEGVAA